MRTSLTRILASVLLVSGCTASTARAADLPSAFFVAKSQNKNQVHYGVHVDDTSCTPIAHGAVWPYWRMLEKGPRTVEALTDGEEKYFGIERQEVEGPTVRIVLRGLPSRPVVITTWRAPNGACTSTTSIRIAGVERRLFNVYVAMKLFGVAYLQLTGWSDDGSVVRERITP